MTFKLKLGLFIGLSIVWIDGFSQELQPPQIFQENAQSIVRILAFDKDGKPIAQGSGVVLSANLVVTNCHVVSDSNFIGVQLEQKRTFAKTSTSHLGDLCLLTLDSAIGKPVRLSSTKPQPGEKVYALGHPKGLDLTISEGLISGFRTMRDGSFLQISAPISPGSSGGALFNSRGQLIGVTTKAMLDSQNINFAAPIDVLTNEINKQSKTNSNQPVPDIGLKDQTTTAITAAKNKLAPPVPVFSDPKQRLEYLRWLDDHSEKLKTAIPEWEVRRNFLQAVWYESRRAGLETELVLAMIQTLSQYRKFHVSEVGARGYMEVGPAWTRIIGDGDPGKLFHMQTNLRFGCVLLRHYLDVKKGDIYAAIHTYLVEVTGDKADKAKLDERIDAVIAARMSLKS